jgi:integrase
MYACGLRIGEATTLEISAVGRAGLEAAPVLRVVGKGNKERLVPLPRPVLDTLRQLWLTHRNRRWLFPNHRGHAARAAPQLCDTAARTPRRCPRRADPARPRQHHVHRRLHPSHHPYAGVAAERR